MSDIAEELAYTKVKLSVLELPAHRREQLISELGGCLKRKRIIDDDDDYDDEEDDQVVMKQSEEEEEEYPLMAEKCKNGNYDLRKICKENDEVYDRLIPDKIAVFRRGHLREVLDGELHNSFSSFLSRGRNIKSFLRIRRNGKVYYLTSD